MRWDKWRLGRPGTIREADVFRAAQDCAGQSLRLRVLLGAGPSQKL